MAGVGLGTAPARFPARKGEDCFMKKLLTRLWILIVASLLVTAGGIFLSASRQESLWMAIAGSVLTLLGAVSACRKVIRLGWAEALVSNAPMVGGAILPTEDDIDQARQKDLDDRAAMLASLLIVLGTSLQVVAYFSRG